MDYNKPAGTHILIDGSGADGALLNDQHRLADLLQSAALECGAGVLKTVSKAFDPQGVTVFCLLSESHISIHTYPEHGAYMADVFTCGDVEPKIAADMIIRAIGGTSKVTTMKRGLAD